MNWPEALVIAVAIFSVAIVAVTWMSTRSGGSQGGGGANRPGPSS